MIFKRAVAKLRAQDWMAIAIELAIVIIGVFAGMQVSDWNQARIEKQQTQRLLEQLVPELRNQVAFFENVKDYYRTTRRYGVAALAGWHGDPRIKADQFVVAAYQASQIYSIGMNAQKLSLTFSGDQINNIGDASLRRKLALVLTADYGPVSNGAVATAYRTDVRRIIPNDIQDQIRAKCGDRPVDNRDVENLYMLPASCLATLDAREVTATAAALRAHPELADELNQHLATIVTYLQDAGDLEEPMRKLENDLEKLSK
jgi:hypothetical protein